MNNKFIPLEIFKSPISNGIKKMINLFLILAMSLSFLSFSPNSFKTTPAKADSQTPTKLTAQAQSETSIELTWEDNSKDELGFEVRMGTSEGKLARVDQVPPERTGTIINKLSKDTTYYFQVAMCDIKNICTSTSGIVSAKTVQAPTNVQAQAVSTTINPNWVGKTPVIGESWDVAMSGQYAYVSSSTGLQVVNISNPDHLLTTGSVDLEYPSAVAVDDSNHAYVGDSKSIKVIDVQDPTNPTVLSTLSLPDYPGDLYISNNKLYVACYLAGVAIVDITSPFAPQLIGTAVDTPNATMSVTATSNTVIIDDSGSASKILTISVTNLLNVARSGQPATFGSVTTPGRISDIKISENGYAYIAANKAGMLVIDFSNPASPHLEPGTGKPTMFGAASGVELSGNRAFVASFSYVSTDNGLQVFDITNPVQPVQQHPLLPVPGFTRGGIAADRDVVCFASSSGGFATIDVANPSTSPRILDLMPQIIRSPSLTSDGSYLYALGYSPAQSHMYIYDIRNPKTPIQTSSLDLSSPSKITLDGDHHAFVSDGMTLKVIEVGNPASPTVLATLDMPNYAQGVYVSGNKLYVACYSAGLVVVDIANPHSPHVIGVVDTPYAALAVAANGGTVVVGDGTTILTISVTNLLNAATSGLPATFGSVTTPDRVSDVKIAENGYAYVAANKAGMLVIDFSNPASPHLEPGTGKPTMFGAASAIDVSGNRAFVASFSYVSTDNGLQVFDITNPVQPVQVGKLLSDNFRCAEDIAVVGRTAFLTNNLYLAEIADLYYDQLKVENTSTCNGVSPCTSVNHNQEITYTLKITNPNPYTFTGLNLSDPIPTGTTYVANSASNNGTSNGTKVTWPNLGFIAPNATIEVSFKVKVN